LAIARYRKNTTLDFRKLCMALNNHMTDLTDTEQSVSGYGKLPNYKDVTVVTVAFGSISVLPRMVRSLPAGVKVVVLDNGPDDGTRQWCLENDVKWFHMGANIGFGKACNAGIEHSSTPWLFFLNPDAELIGNCLHELLLATLIHNKAPAYGPMHLLDDGSVWYKLRSGISKIKIPKGLTSTYSRVPFISGAAILISRKIFIDIGGFDPKIFLYFEDDDICRRLTHKYGDLILTKPAHIKHAGGQSSEITKSTSTIKEYNFGKSEAYVLFKHLGLRPTIIKFIFHVLKIMSPRNIFIPYYLSRWKYRTLGFLKGLADTSLHD
jgi:N-acetylglucosaminyl-diphospho-decaprenol L-rhamnosyltransferase